ncbi:MAG TPA: alpha/beta hydrolase [Methylophilaceae bacterium]|jgi:acetyl esterase/lipase
MSLSSNLHRDYQETSFLSQVIKSNIALRIYQPSQTALSTSLVLYFHGGLFNCGNLDDADAMASLLAENAVVVCVDYPLAPKLHFPATVEVAFEALLWASKHATEFGANRAKLIVAGDQAGGNLAAAVAMMARDRGLTGKARLIGQVLINPMLDPLQTTLSMQAAEDCPCRKAWTDYLPTTSDAMHPYAAPLLSQRLIGLVSALIITSDRDPLRDEAEQYAAKLITAGVPVQIRRLEAERVSLASAGCSSFKQTAAIVSQFVTDFF